MRLHPITSLTAGLSLGAALVFGCGGSQASTVAPAASSQPAAAVPAAPPRSLHAHGGQERTLHMQTHFWAAIDARDALIGADIEAARHSLRWLAEHQEPASMSDAGPDLEAMRATAREAAEAGEAAGVALGIAHLGARCGACHAAMDVAIAPAEEEGDQGVAPLGPEHVEDRMGRHAWSVDELWSGLVFPSEQAWSRGVAVLSEIPEAPPVDEGRAPVPAALNQELEGVRGLAARAAAARDTEARAQVFADLLTSCQGCHAR